MTLSPPSRHWPTAAIALVAAAAGTAIGFGWRSESPLPRVAAMTSLSHDSFAVCTAPWARALSRLARDGDGSAATGRGAQSQAAATTTAK